MDLVLYNHYFMYRRSQTIKHDRFGQIVPMKPLKTVGYQKCHKLTACTVPYLVHILYYFVRCNPNRKSTGYILWLYLAAEIISEINWSSIASIDQLKIFIYKEFKFYFKLLISFTYQIREGIHLSRKANRILLSRFPQKKCFSGGNKYPWGAYYPYHRP